MKCELINCNENIQTKYPDKNGHNYCIFHTQNDDKLAAFLEKIKEKFKKEDKPGNIARMDYFYFPSGFSFNEDFRLSESDIVFNDAYFNNVNFSGIEFKGAIEFNNCTFTGEIRFDDIKFYSNMKLISATFKDSLKIRDIVFKSDASFDFTIFQGPLLIEKTVFCNKASFLKAEFYKEAVISKCLFFSSSTFERLDFNSSQFILKDCSFFEYTTFQNNDLTHFKFVRCLLNKVSFLGSNVKETQFLNCDWDLQKKSYLVKSKLDEISEFTLLKESEILTLKEEIKSNLKRSRNRSWDKISRRLVLIDEANLKQKKSKWIKEKTADTYKEGTIFEEVADVYRQLKINMDNRRQFHLSDQFYCGEMEMQYEIRKNAGMSRILLYFYRMIGYGNRPVKTILYFFAFMFIFSAIVYIPNFNEIKNIFDGTNRAILSIQELFTFMIYNITAPFFIGGQTSIFEPLTSSAALQIAFIQTIIRPLFLAFVIWSAQRKVFRS